MAGYLDHLGMVCRYDHTCLHGGTCSGTSDHGYNAGKSHCYCIVISAYEHDPIFYSGCDMHFAKCMQGIGDSITPVISSSLELLCKVLVAVFLTPYLGYWAIIWSEPISWVIMVIPLLIRIANNPVLKGNQTN